MEAHELFSNLQLWDWEIRAILSSLLVFIGPFLMTWTITSWNAKRAIAVAQTVSPGLKRPPTLPYYIPFLGHAFQFMGNGGRLMSKTTQYLGRTVPVQLILPMFPSYVVSGPESISTFFRDSKSGDLSGVNRGVKWGTDAFGCPAHSIHLFKPPKKEISLLLSGIVHTGLSDPNLSAMTSRFQEFLIQLIEKDTPGKVGDNWVELPDLTAFVEKYVFDATICAMFGTHILRLNPNFAEEFWEFDRNIGSLFMGVPRWFKPQAHRAREKILERIKTWVIYTKKNCDIENVKDLDWEPFYGSRFNRERQGVLTMRGILDETARASDNLAFIWAAGANSVPAAVWFLYETLKDRSLQNRVHNTIHKDRSKSEKGTLIPFDVSKLCSDALLQSMYAETLRLRVAAFVIREAAKDDYSFRGWHIKKSEILSITTRTESLNEEVWNTGSPENPHPLDEFWPDRFIVDPKNPHSGPLLKQRVKKSASASDSDSPYFSMDGTSASWIPYGGGANHCPGRHFAKRQIITATAILLSAYEFELAGQGGINKPDVDMRTFGFGTMPPNRPIPFRVRRRRV